MANIPNKKEQNLPSAPHSADNGIIRVHESVISSIVRKAVLGTKGVIRFAGNSFVDNIAEFVGSKAMQDRAITIEMGDGAVCVEVQIILAYGTYIPDVATKVQDAIRTQVQDTTGMPVEKVNVIVMDIEQQEEDSDGEADNE